MFVPRAEPGVELSHSRGGVMTDLCGLMPPESHHGPLWLVWGGLTHPPKMAPTASLFSISCQDAARGGQAFRAVVAFHRTLGLLFEPKVVEMGMREREKKVYILLLNIFSNTFLSLVFLNCELCWFWEYWDYGKRTILGWGLPGQPVVFFIIMYKGREWKSSMWTLRANVSR